MNNFRELVVWKKSISLVVKIYQTTSSFPGSEKYSLAMQMQRAATSIPSNIAEGTGRNSNTAFKHFLTIAIGSAHELETQLIISEQLGYVATDATAVLLSDLTEIQKMLFRLHSVLKND